MKILIAASAALLFIACDSNNSSKDKTISDIILAEKPADNISDYKPEEFEAGFFSPDSTAKQEQNDKFQQKQPPATKPVPNPEWDKKIIKTADLNMEVKDYNIFYNSLRQSIRDLGGYVAQEEQQQSEYKIENTIVIKVPVDQFDAALTKFGSGSEKINERKVTSKDVSAEYIDTKARTEAKKQVRLKYMDLLKQAKNMEEILSVQSEINEIQEEIESAASRIEYLGHSSSFSTINCTIYQVLDPGAKNNERPSFGERIASSFKSGWQWITELVVGLISIWPLYILIFVLIIIYKKIRSSIPKPTS